MGARSVHLVARAYKILLTQIFKEISIRNQTFEEKKMFLCQQYQDSRICLSEIRLQAHILLGPAKIPIFCVCFSSSITVSLIIQLARQRPFLTPSFCLLVTALTAPILDTNDQAASELSFVYFATCRFTTSH